MENHKELLNKKKRRNHFLKNVIYDGTQKVHAKLELWNVVRTLLQPGKFMNFPRQTQFSQELFFLPCYNTGKNFENYSHASKRNFKV